MGINFCNCGYNNDDTNNKQNTETNLSIFEKYSNMKATTTSATFEDEFRTKAGTEWKKIKGLEKIVTLYNINFIIKKYREHLDKRKKDKKNIDE